MLDFNIPLLTWFSPFGNVGLLLLSLALLGGAYNYLFILTSKKAKAVVVRLAPRDAKNGTVYDPVYTFQTEKGQEVTGISKVSSGEPSFKVGQEIEVLYSRLNRHHTKINNPPRLFLTSTLLGVVGILFIIAEIIMKIQETGNTIFRSILQLLGLGG